MQYDEFISKKIAYTFSLLGINKGVKIRCVNSKHDADVVLGEKPYPIEISTDFYAALKNGDFNSKSILNSDGWITTQDGSIDYLSTAFYMINSFQEYFSSDLDEIGRFKFSASYQYRLGGACNNQVQYCFDKIWEIINPKGTFKRNPSKVFLTHDIDSVNGALVQDGYYSLKKGNLKVILQLIWNVILQQPDWLNMDKIMKLESEYDFKSTFFWLVNKGKTKDGLRNGDYHVTEKSIQSIQKQITDNGFINGLHKSISTDSFETELSKIPGVASNRNHYLKMQLPHHYKEIEKSGLKLDTTLGFAEQHGFRNSYGLPFTPYNLENDRPYSFVEAPLHIMDGTFQKYYRWNLSQTSNAIGDFIEKNRYNCVLTFLWHNTFFTQHKFKGYLEIYRSILTILKEMEIRSITPTEIISEYSIHE